LVFNILQEFLVVGFNINRKAEFYLFYQDFAPDSCRSVLDHVAVGIIEYWQHKNRIAKPEEKYQAECLAHLIICVSSVYEVPVSLARSFVIAPFIVGPDMTELARICRDLLHGVDVKAYDSRIKAVWKRNLKYLHKTHLSILYTMMNS
jgi:hypothetical protein